MQFCVKRWLGWERGVACISLWILMKDEWEHFFLSVLGQHPPVAIHMSRPLQSYLASTEEITAPESTSLCPFLPLP